MVRSDRLYLSTTGYNYIRKSRVCKGDCNEFRNIKRPNETMNWSKQTYRLDQINRKVKLPCVVRVTDGYYGDVEAESFSQGDMIKIDQYKTLRKVAANFVDGPGSRSRRGGGEEILIPLNYNGKLTVLSELKVYGTVSAISEHRPRYAKLLDSITIPYDYKGGGTTLPSGTILEIDRELPAVPGVNGQPSREASLVFSYTAPEGQAVPVQLPLETNVRMRVEPDSQEYTLKEVVNRYSLPQTVVFTSDEIQKVFTQDLIEGVENMTKVTGVVCLNKLVQQQVLIGHYKGLDEAADAASEFVRRSIIVIPIGRLWDIEVNVLEEEDSDYEIFVAKNFSRSEDTDGVDGVLYADFSKKPAMAKLPTSRFRPPPASRLPPPPAVGSVRKQEDDSPPLPPRPHKPGQPRSKLPLPAVPESRQQVLTQSALSEIESDSGNYITMEPQEGFTLAEMKFGSMKGREYVNAKQSPDVPLLPENAEDEFWHKEESDRKKGSTSSVEDTRCPVEYVSDDDDFDDTHVYDELNVDETLALPISVAKRTWFSRSKKAQKAPSLPPVVYKVPPSKLVPPAQYQTPPTRRGNQSKPVASVPSTPNKGKPAAKPLAELTVDELDERLRLCRLDKLAELCSENFLDGRFFMTISDKELTKEPYKLDKIQMQKIGLMKKQNWIPDRGQN